jgi:protein-S-isoprenylcysteine O-methyltransferase Ste14
MRRGLPPIADATARLLFGPDHWEIAVSSTKPGNTMDWPEPGEWSFELSRRNRWFRARGLAGSVTGIAGAVAVLISVPMIRADTWLALVLNILGWLFFLTGMLLRLWSTLYIGARKEWTLVSEGPYSLCRNPLYLGSLLVGLSFGLFVNSLAFLVIISTTAIIYALGTVRAEEDTLLRNLGEPYARYCERTPRFWPKFSLFHTSESIEIKAKGLRIEFKRLLRWIWVPMALEIVSYLRSMPWYPGLFHLP